MLPAGGGGPDDFAKAPVGVMDWRGLSIGGGGGLTVRPITAARDPDDSDSLRVTFRARHCASLKLRSDMLVNRKEEPQKHGKCKWKSAYQIMGNCMTEP